MDATCPPDFLIGTPLLKTIKSYEFFRYSTHEALFLSEKEEQALNTIITGIEQEYQSVIDKHSQQIIVSQIDTLRVQWPDGKVQILNDLKANQTLTLNYESALDKSGNKPSKFSPRLFKNITEKSDIDFIHKENECIDFEFEKLMPRMISNEGPKLAVGDVNGEIRDIKMLNTKGNTPLILVSRNNESPKLFKHAQ